MISQETYERGVWCKGMCTLCGDTNICYQYKMRMEEIKKQEEQKANDKLVKELENSIKLLREYCDPKKNCKKCLIKEKIKCTYGTDNKEALAPYNWNENN